MRPARVLGLLSLAAVAAVPALAGAGAGGGGSSAGAPRPDRPNVLVILTDDQRADSLDVMPKTRRLFGEEGTSFTRGYLTTPMCCPSRASIFTGRYSHNHGVLINRDADKLDMRSTFQAYLDEAGYRSAYMGKFLNSWPISDRPPDYERWAIFRDGYYDAEFNVSGSLLTIPRYTTEYLRSESVRFIQQAEAQDNKPWLLFVSVYAPHWPASPEDRHRGAPVPSWEASPAVLEEDRSDKPSYVRAKSTSPTFVRRFRRKQLRTLMSVDDLVGRLFREMEAQGEEDTLAFFLTDNGYLYGEHGLPGKGVPYAPSVQTPLFVRWPGHVAAGKVDDRLVANIDVAATILDALGISPDSRWPLDGRSLLASGARERLLLEFWRLPRYFVPTWASTVTDDYQYIEYYDEEGHRTFREYYDLRSDPWQLTNLLKDGNAANDPVVQTLADTLREDRRCEGTGGSVACP